MNKRILVLGDMGSIWSKLFIDNVLLHEGDEVVLYPLWGVEDPFASFYADNHVTVYRDSHRLPLIGKIPKLRLWVRNRLNLRDLRAMGPFDVIQTNYLVPKSLFLSRGLKTESNRWVCSFWGSDLLRASDHTLRVCARLMKRADKITLHKQEMQERFERAAGTALSPKIVQLRCGIIGLDALEKAKTQTTPARCKEHFGIALNTLAVAVGYSAGEEHRHLPIVKELSKLPDGILRRLTLVFQMNYGGHREGYVQEVAKEAGKLPCQSVFVEKFLEPDELALLRMACDAFILSNPTDAYAGALQENLFAGTIALIPKWLRYPQLDELGVDYVSYD
ncbi:MAG: hypothetical protein EOM69_11675, partial [Clostridia bacterium]|nr:hypothetical protein [Clostridia bacterium]